jgi:hypothetical protein
MSLPPLQAGEAEHLMAEFLATLAPIADAGKVRLGAFAPTLAQQLLLQGTRRA